MQWLSDWLKQLIIIVMLAAFVDLLLPNNAMQRYVKLVVSLFIILVLLSPIIHLLNSPKKVEEMLTGIDSNPRMSATAIPALADIYEQGERLAQDNELQTKQLVEQQLAEQLSRSLAQATGESVQRIEVQTAKDKEGNPYIEQVQAVLAVVMEGGEESEPPPSGDIEKPIAYVEPIRPITPIEPVKIGGKGKSGALDSDTNDGADPFRDDAEAAAVDERSLSASLQSRRERVAQYIQETWQIEAEKITVVFDQGF